MSEEVLFWGLVVMVIPVVLLVGLGIGHATGVIDVTKRRTHDDREHGRDPFDL